MMATEEIPITCWGSDGGAHLWYRNEVGVLLRLCDGDTHMVDGSDPPEIAEGDKNCDECIQLYANDVATMKPRMHIHLSGMIYTEC